MTSTLAGLQVGAGQPRVVELGIAAFASDEAPLVVENEAVGAIAVLPEDNKLTVGHRTHDAVTPRIGEENTAVFVDRWPLGESDARGGLDLGNAVRRGALHHGLGSRRASATGQPCTTRGQC